MPKTRVAALAAAALMSALSLLSAVPAAARTREPALPTGPLDPNARPPLVHVIPLDGFQEIDMPMSTFLKRCLADARNQAADIVVLQLDTPGGAKYVLKQMIEAIEAHQGGMTVAWVSGHAYSAGSLVALACDKVYMTDHSNIGDAQPIIPMLGEEGLRPIEKLVSPARAEWGGVAERHGRPVRLAEAMVDLEMEVYEVRVDGETRYLTSLDIEALRREGRDPQPGNVVCEKGHLLTVSGKQAFRMGLADGIANTREDVWAHLGLKKPIVVVQARTAGETWAVWLYDNNLWFLALGLLGLFLEFKVPGFGVPGILGLACLAVFFGSAYMVGSASAIEISIFLLGCVLLALELFVVPGFGITGIAGLMFMFVGLVLALNSFGLPSDPYEWAVFNRTLLGLALTLLGTFAASMVVSQFLPKVPLFSHLQLQAPRPTSLRGSAAGQTLADSPAVGEIGRALSTLRPSGRADFEGRPVDVVTTGEFIDAGTPVEVVERQGNRIVVERQRETEAREEGAS